MENLICVVFCQMKGFGSVVALDEAVNSGFQFFGRIVNTVAKLLLRGHAVPSSPLWHEIAGRIGGYERRSKIGT